MAKRRYTIESIDVAFLVAECFVDAPDGKRGVTEVSKLTGLRKDRVFRILTTMAERGYVEQEDSSQKYRLGPGFLVLGEAFRRQLNLRRIAGPFLDELAKDSGDAAHLFVRHGNQSICIDVRTGRHILQAPAEIGEIVPRHIGAAPKILLAYEPEEERDRILKGMTFPRKTAKTIVTRIDLEKELGAIREQGYCVAEDDYEVGAYAIGAPIRDHASRVVAALSLVVPLARSNARRKKELVQLVLSIARRLSEKLGHGVELSGREQA